LEYHFGIVSTGISPSVIKPKPEYLLMRKSFKLENRCEDASWNISWCGKASTGKSSGME